MRLLRNKTAVVATGLALVVLTAAVAYAYWTNTGTGSGSASAGSNTSITVKQTSSVAGLYPGGPAVTLAGNFDNPNAGAVFVHQVAATLSSVSGGSANPSLPACTTDDFSLAGGPVTVDAEVPAGTGVGAWSGITVRLLNTGANQDNCKGATVHISYTSN
jgi:hypothetical protein